MATCNGDRLSWYCGGESKTDSCSGDACDISFGRVSLWPRQSGSRGVSLVSGMSGASGRCTGGRPPTLLRPQRLPVEDPPMVIGAAREESMIFCRGVDPPAVDGFECREERSKIGGRGPAGVITGRSSSDSVGRATRSATAAAARPTALGRRGGSAALPGGTLRASACRAKPMHGAAVTPVFRGAPASPEAEERRLGEVPSVAAASAESEQAV